MAIAVGRARVRFSLPPKQVPGICRKERERHSGKPGWSGGHEEGAGLVMVDPVSVADHVVDRRHRSVGAGEQAEGVAHFSLLGMQASQPVQGEHLDFDVPFPVGVRKHPRELFSGLGYAVVGVQRGQQKVSQRGVLSPARRVLPLLRGPHDHPGGRLQVFGASRRPARTTDLRFDAAFLSLTDSASSIARARSADFLRTAARALRRRWA